MSVQKRPLWITRTCWSRRNTLTQPVCSAAVERIEEKNRKRKSKIRENSMPPVWLKASRLLSGLLCFELNSCESLTPALNPRSSAAAAQLSALKGGRQGTREKGSYVKSRSEGGEGELPMGLPCITVASRRARHLVPRSHVFWAQDQRQMWAEQTRRDETSAARLRQKSTRAGKPVMMDWWRHSAPGKDAFWKRPLLVFNIQHNNAIQTHF